MIPSGSTVTFHYTLMVDGWVVETSNGRQPLSYQQGDGEILPGLEENIQSMGQGEKRKFLVPPEKGYGVRNPDAVTKIPRERFEGAEDLTLGCVVGGRIGGYRFQGTVVDLDDESVTLDLNHPLAGKMLDFEIEVVGVNSGEATA